MVPCGYVIALTDRQRKRVLEQAWPRVYQEERPVVGEEVPIADDVTLLVLGATLEKGKGWLVEYALRDFRPRLLRDSPFGGYTTVPGRALRFEGEAVPASFQDTLTAEAHAFDTVRADAGLSREAEKRGVVDWLRDTLQECQARGIDTSSVEYVTQRQVARLRRRLANT